MIRAFKIALFLAVAAFFGACASNGDLAKLDNLYFEQKNLKDSYKYAQKYAEDDFLWAFQSGVLAYQSGDFASSEAHLNASEVFFEGISGENGFSSAFKTFSAILIKDGMFEYEGYHFEGVFANFYKALSAVWSENYSKARVEFNRANDRARRAKEYFNERIQEQNEAMQTSADEYRSQAQNVDVQKSYDNVAQIYAQRYKNLAQYAAFEGYANPYISYVSGIFFMLQNDFNKANDLLKESYAITQNAAILKDISILESRKKSTKDSRYTWIFIEDGAIPAINEARIDVPLFLITSKSFLFSIALPFLEERGVSSGNFSVRANAKTAQDSSFEIANIAPILKNEFEAELPYKILIALLSSSYKSYLQYFLQEQFGILGSLGGMLFSALTASADTRSARILANRFYVLRLKNAPQKFALYNGGVNLASFQMNEKCANLCANRDNFIYARIIGNDIIALHFHSFK